MDPHSGNAVDGEIMISARGLTKTFGELRAVDAIDFDVRRGKPSDSSAPTAPANRLP
jgi:ABC-type transporter Mla maintaining outer membrane lipid asymmetry ATPase subunit MlaF